MKKVWVLVCLGMLGCGSEEVEEVVPVEDVTEAPETVETTVATGWCVSDEPILLGDDNVFGACQDPELSLVPCGGRVNNLVIGTNGEVGQGLDVDGDPDTCAPEASCKDGVDNQLSILSALAQEGIDEALESGTLMLFLEFIDPPGGPGVFPLKMHVARIDETDEECNWQTEVCSYRIRQDSYDDECSPPVIFDDVTVEEDGSFTAGEGGIEISLNIPLFGVSVSLPVKSARLEGTITWAESGTVEHMEGLLAGGIPKAELVEAISGIPAEEFAAGTSLDKETIVAALEALVINDLDLDGDGELESASFGAIVGSVPGVLLGWE